MSTFKNIREVYESAADCADTIRREIKYDDADEERQQELVWQEADRRCIYTQDNWDVCNIMRGSNETYEAVDMVSPFNEHDSIDEYMTALAYAIWEQLIREALNEEDA